MSISPSFATAAHSDLENYIVTIMANGENLVFKGAGNSIRAWMPQNLQLQVSAQYESVLGSMAGELASAAGSAIASRGGPVGAIAGALVGVAGNAVANGSALAAATTGNTMQFKKATLKTWRSSSPLSLNLPLIFMAVTDPFLDVKVPAAALMSTCLPSEKTEVGGYNFANGLNIGGFNIAPGPMLIAPGPTFGDTKANTFQVKYGNILYMDSCLITSASLNAESLVYSDGQLIGCQVDVTVETTMMTTVEDFTRWFFTGSANTTVQSTATGTSSTTATVATPNAAADSTNQSLGTSRAASNNTNISNPNNSSPANKSSFKG